MPNVNTALEGEGGGGEKGKYLIWASYCVSVPRVLTKVVSKNVDN